MPQWLCDKGAGIQLVVVGLSMDDREREEAIAVAGLQSRSALVESA